jgi:hypothetical protein
LSGTETKEVRAARYRAEAERIRSEATSILIDQSSRDQLLQIAEQYDLLAASTERLSAFD